MLGVFLSLDQSTLYNNDFSSDSSLKVTGTIYSDIGKTTAFNLTGYTIKLGLYRDGSLAALYDESCTITVAASGTFYINVTSDTLPIPGIYQARVQLTKSGTQTTSLNRVEVLVKKGP